MPTQPQITLEKPGKFSQTTGPVPEPAPGEALVRVHRVGVCGTDLHAFAGRQPFFEYPRILGHELGVEVISLGQPHASLAPGDLCAVEPYLNNPASQASQAGKSNCCEDLQVLGIHIDGGMRPIISVPVEKLHRSQKLDCDRLALVEMLCIGAHAAGRARPEHGEFALVIGAGPIGLATLQFAAAVSTNIVVMDISARRLGFARAHFHVRDTVNPAEGDIEEQLRSISGGNLPTLIFDATGNPASMMRTFDLAAHGGRIVFVGLFQGEVTFNDPNFHRKELTLLSSRNATAADFHRVIGMFEAGTIDTGPWISHRLALEAVPENFESLAKDPELIKAIIEVES